MASFETNFRGDPLYLHSTVVNAATGICVVKVFSMTRHTVRIEQDLSFLVVISLVAGAPVSVRAMDTSQVIGEGVGASTWVLDLVSGAVVELGAGAICVFVHLPVSSFEASQFPRPLLVLQPHVHGAVGSPDGVMLALTSAMMAAHDAGQGLPFLVAMSQAIKYQFFRAYCGVRDISCKAPGALAPWQLQAAEEFMIRSAENSVDADALADLCGISPSYFRRAFRKSTGLTPNQWMMRHRVEQACDQLRDATASLASVAAQCGFADQSHLTRAFSSVFGMTPARWRKANVPGPAGRETDGEQAHG